MENINIIAALHVLKHNGSNVLIINRILKTYLACLLRSVTFTFPRTRLRYNLEQEQGKVFQVSIL